MKVKAIFLTHRNLFRSAITGGVQLCSQEFHYLIENTPGIELHDYYVPFTRNIFQRIQIRLGMENYSMYDVKKDAPALLKYVEQQDIGVVFLNMASTIRYARPLKQKFGEKIKVILLSHGNHSGDFIHLITKPLNRESRIKQLLKQARLGVLISTEAMYRLKYIDGVVTISETERQIENWINAKNTVFFPRFLKPEFLNYAPDLSRIGFVGRLDHPPNLQGMQIFCEAFKNYDAGLVKIRLVGAPEREGRKLQQQYAFIEYQGELSDEALKAEVAGWAMLLNPVWWYSTGASTKLAKAIGWGIPIATTTAGMRGYAWKEGRLLVADTPSEMVTGIIDSLKNKETIMNFADETRKAAMSGPRLHELTAAIERMVFPKS